MAAQPKMVARPYIEEWISKASDDDRCTLSEFIAVLEGTADSGSVHDTLRALIKISSIDYVRQCLDTIEQSNDYTR
jgi:hypothetical protein